MRAAPVPGLAVHRTTQAGAARLAGSGRYRAVICGLGGRVALPGTYAAARRRGIPFVLWATIWAHPRTPAHALSLPATRHLYRHADAVVTYGAHVSRYVEQLPRRPRATCSWRPRRWTWTTSARRWPTRPGTRRRDAGRGRRRGAAGALRGPAGGGEGRATCCWTPGGSPPWARARGWRWPGVASLERLVQGRRPRRPLAWLRCRIRPAGAVRGGRRARAALDREPQLSPSRGGWS